MGNNRMHLNNSEIEDSLKKTIHFVEENIKVVFPSHYGDKKMNSGYTLEDDYIRGASIQDDAFYKSKLKYLNEQIEQLQKSLNKSTEENKKLKEHNIILRKKIKELEYDIEVMQI